MHRVTECKASPDYKLWLKFEDGFGGERVSRRSPRIGRLQGLRM